MKAQRHANLKVSVPRRSQAWHRGVSAFSSSDGAIRFCVALFFVTLCALKREEPQRPANLKVGVPRRSQARHRGVSAPSLRDGAIPRYPAV
jgi:hypothetical protein